MTFHQWWEAEKQSPSARNSPTRFLWEEQCARHAWNAAVEACEAIVAEKHDPCEPWLDPGDLTKALEVEVKT